MTATLNLRRLRGEGWLSTTELLQLCRELDTPEAQALPPELRAELEAAAAWLDPSALSRALSHGARLPFSAQRGPQLEPERWSAAAHATVVVRAAHAELLGLQEQRTQAVGTVTRDLDARSTGFPGLDALINLPRRHLELGLEVIGGLPGREELEFVREDTEQLLAYLPQSDLQRAAAHLARAAVLCDHNISTLTRLLALTERMPEHEGLSRWTARYLKVDSSEWTAYPQVILEGLRLLDGMQIHAPTPAPEGDWTTQTSPAAISRDAQHLRTALTLRGNGNELEATLRTDGVQALMTLCWLSGHLDYLYGAATQTTLAEAGPDFTRLLNAAETLRTWLDERPGERAHLAPHTWAGLQALSDWRRESLSHSPGGS